MDSSDASEPDIPDPAPPPEAASPPAPDPGLIRLDIRQHDFSDPAQAGPETAEGIPLAAYQPFRPGIWAGIGPGGSARLRSARAAGGRQGLILSLDAAGAPWISLEIELDSAGLIRTGAALFAIEAAASPLANVNMLLRVPCRAAPDGFRDSRPQNFLLNADLTRRSLAFFPPVDEVTPHDGFPNPVLIAFLPLRRTEIFLTGLAAGPAL